MRKRHEKGWRHIQWMTVAVMAFCLAGCEGEKEDASMRPFDPGKPVTITNVTPQKAGMGARVLVYGTNFGDDISKVEVTIGGINAKVIGMAGGCIYCIMPAKAYDGTIQVSVLDKNGETLAASEITEKTAIVYEKKMLVTTFIGKMNENGTYDTKDGPFEDCGGFGGCTWMVVDPKNPNHMYFVGEQHPLRKVDFETRMVSTLSNNIPNSKWAFLWSPGGDSLLVVRHNVDAQINNIYYATRDAGFINWTGLVIGNQCRSAATHPVNGEMYYNQIEAGKVYRYDFETQQKQEMFSVQESGEAFIIVFHPSGNYAYFLIYNKHYIMRSDYDWENKKLTTPYLVCGRRDAAGWVDGVGGAARLNGGLPSQGCFVKNQQYVDEGKSDQYDFYFCERNNHCIRTLTPEGKVTTFAGRGSNGTSGYNDGDLRLEARFKFPEALVYDEAKQCFYVGDRENRCIRKIGYEDADD
jgi:hypothetical protein